MLFIIIQKTTYGYKRVFFAVYFQNDRWKSDHCFKKKKCIHCDWQHVTPSVSFAKSSKKKIFFLIGPAASWGWKKRIGYRGKKSTWGWVTFRRFCWNPTCYRLFKTNRLEPFLILKIQRKKNPPDDFQLRHECFYFW